ncbi:hypothetical protein NBT05_18190 [Aquimarina sp. ERC-38]|uniref:HYC_CC_PP family protein n=1 Tax=Aquimarina sp. ERC-38 TaxID=2949996 RepID=UPI002246C9B3|nr:hypothetical protein [Aquimarina sp. ERC-38]UZO80856.1 hypothetical protein NBT05_18190 [Aquimarina sp. ERC-38]
MIKKALLRISSSLLAMLVLLSSFSFSVHCHYCGHFLKDTSYVVPSKGCGMEKVADALQDICKADQIKKSCCTDHTHIVDGKDVVSVEKNRISFNHLVAIPYQLTDVYFFNPLQNEITPFIGYDPPPPPNTALYIKHQCFLI